MKILFSILIICFINTSVGQTTKTLLFNLPLEQGESIVKKHLLADTLNFTKKDVLRWKQKQYITIPMFYSKSIPKIYFPQPENLTLTIEDWVRKPDTALVQKLTTFLNYFNKSKKKDVKLLYDKLIDNVKMEYDSCYRNTMIGQVTSKNKKWDVNETTTYFYTKSGDNYEKLSITWFDEGKHAQTISITYTFEKLH